MNQDQKSTLSQSLILRVPEDVLGSITEDNINELGVHSLFIKIGVCKLDELAGPELEYLVQVCKEEIENYKEVKLDNQRVINEHNELVENWPHTHPGIDCPYVKVNLRLADDYINERIVEWESIKDELEKVIAGEWKESIDDEIEDAAQRMVLDKFNMPPFPELDAEDDLDSAGQLLNGINLKEEETDDIE